MKTLARLLVAVLLLTAPALRAGNVINTLPNAASNERPLDLSSPHFATAFTTGSAPGKLGSITVKLRSTTAANNARVQLWSSATSSSVPTDLVEDLGTRSIPVSGDTDWTFTSTLAPPLDAGARYWVSVAYVTGGGTLYWKNATSSAATTSDSGASMADTRAGSNLAGTSWTFQTGTRTQLFSVTSANERVVTTTADEFNTPSGASVSLREALRDATDAAGPDLITFAPSLSGQSIQLSTHSPGLQGETALFVNNTEGISIDASSLPGGITITRPAGASGDGYHALYLEAGCSLTLRGLTIAGFKAQTNTHSGAIFSLGTLTLDRCTLTGNSTNLNGGAIYNQGGTLTLTHCTLSGNASTAFYGGAIFNTGTTTLTHCTVVGNTAAATGGGIYNFANSLTLTNCIVASNTATGGSGPDIFRNAGTVTATGKNLLSSTDSSSLSAGTTVIVNASPQLAGLAYYGGGTATMPPLAGSPAIDPTGGDSSSSFATDQRGQPRVVDGDGNTSTIADIGAVEYSAAASALSAVVVNNAAAGLGSLVDTISAAPAGGTITFAPALSGATISPASEITLDKNLTIDGTGLAIAPILSGGGSHRILAVVSGSTVVLTRLTLQDGNAGGGGGGGILNAGTLTVNQSTLSGNHADNSSGGGGILNAGTLTVNQSTLSGNHADNSEGGGGIFSGSSSDTITLTDSLIAGNTATGGSGPDVSTPTGPAINTTGRNFIGDTAGSGLSASSSLLTTAQNGPANLAPLGNYGGPTPTMPPMAGSPAIDATSADTITDQRGFSAQDGDANGSVLADIGAAEAQVMLVTTATDEDDGTTATGSGTGTSLREAIADTSGHADIIRFDPAVFNGQPADIIRLTVANGSNKQITIARSLSVDARNLPSGVTLSGDSDSSGNPSSGDTRIFQVNANQTVALHGLTLKDGKDGGGIGGGIVNSGTLTVNQCTLSGNHADNGIGGGGGIYNNGTLTVTQSTLSGNHADNSGGGGGGGIFNNGTLTVNQSTLSGNHADNSAWGGGGIVNSGTLTVNQSTLSGNHADNSFGGGGGGCIYNLGTLTVNQSTLSGNHADNSDGGGGIFSGSSGDVITLTNSLIAGNSITTGTGPDVYNTGTAITTNGRNFIGDTTSSGLSASGTLLTGDAKLAPLGNYGGPTQTMALLPGSPALNAALGSTATTDQRGFPIVGTADIGAYESQGSTVTLTSSDNPAIFGQNVTFTATVNELDPQTITPTGTVTFRADGNALGSPVTLNASGIATLTTSTLTAGAHTVTATYSGDARLLTSTSNTINQSVLDLSVGNGNDSGPVSLRQALANAAAHPGPDTITLPIGLNGQTLTLTSELLVNDSGGVTIDASGLSNGFTISGGGNVRLFTVAPGSTVTLKNLTLINGKGVGGGVNGIGGAIYNQTGATLTLESCALSGHTTNIGGAIFNNGGVLTLSRCAFSGNNANATGGAVHTVGVGSLAAVNCTFTGNTASTGGGAILCSNSQLSLVHCTITQNISTSGTGGVVFNGGTVTLKGNIIATNTTGDDDKDVGGSGAVLTLSTNLIGVPASQYLSALGSGLPNASGQLVGTTAAPLNPQLNVLGNYGGPTPTMPLLPGSPALDQASVLNPALTTDQRGFPRPVGVRPDIGAVEGTVIVVTTPVDELDAPGALGNGVSLREAVRDVEAGGTIVFDRAVFNSTTTNTLTLTKGPLNPQRNCTLNGSLNPGGITILHTLTITQQPVPLSVASTAAANFAVVVTNLSGGLAFQWRKDGSDMGGQTNAALALANVQEGDEAVYDVTLSEAPSPGTLTLNNVNLTPASARSQPASLIVNGSSVNVQRGPSSAMLALGSSHTLSVVAIGPALPALTYQWRKNGVNLSGATKSSYVITNAQLAHAGAYTCLVKSGTTGVPVPSGVAEIGVVDTRAKTVNLLASATASFTPVVSAAGNGLSYAWFINGTPSVTSKLFAPIKPVGVANAGLYTCTVTGPGGSISTGCNTRLNVSTAVPTLVTPLQLPAATIGQAYFYQIPVTVAAGAPATVFNIAGTLPTGVTYNTITGIISGRPTVTKPTGYPLTIKAGNAKGWGPTAPATLTVNAVPTTAVGTFAGPMARSSLNSNLGGRFDLTTTATGLCSGGITLGARTKIPFTNQLLLSHGTGDVILRGNIPGITLADKTVLIAYVEVFASDQRAVLTLVHPTLGTTLQVPAWRNPWLLSKTVALNNPATAYAAYYTARLDAGTGGTVSPSGYGYASFTVSTAGTLTLAGKLPDGSAVTGGAFVSKDGEIALFNLLYATTNRGSHVGQFNITPSTPVTNNVVAGTTTWSKPAPLTATTSDTVYKNGFGPLTVTAAGAPYVAPAKGAIVPGFTAVALGGTNAKFSFTLGGLDTEAKEFQQLARLYNPSTIGLTNIMTIAAPVLNNTKTIATGLTASSGEFKINFTIAGASAPLNRAAPCYGLLVKIGATTQGYGFFLLPTATAKISTSPKLSGRVVLGVP